jgi:N6-L-threonylcarbamoyladenine synthase
MTDPTRSTRDLSAVRTVLGIETSCDETAAAVVRDGRIQLSSVISSQVDRHARYGGVVPEIASRAHVEMLNPVIAEAVVQAGIADDEIDAVAATYGPGLVGSLLVGVSAAKALALVWDVPFVAVNHLEAHLYAAMLEDPTFELPVVVLLVSGGHTMIVHWEDHGRLTVLGGTIDDAAGEAYDKVARYLGLGYPGGPVIDRISIDGDPGAIAFPRALPDRPYDFSFSGLKTSVVNHVRKHPDVSAEDVAASFQEAVVDVLVTKTRRAAADVGAKGISIGGGVAANSRLREQILTVCAEDGLAAYLPDRANCTDNAAMVAAAGWWQLQRAGESPLDTGAEPGLGLGSPAA